ncbi:MAG: ArsC family reductase [Halothiobacillus sp. 14-56-357]|jgi:Spx/MgsR family transcriptional regulator|uniref:ArsC family reductase n=1 Tax=Halothiobacillus sp. 15-55-196 TaxID=1970382 RepID=UPI000BC9A62A|nr:ArsC family reductase [Halothiobacillus sp. 15-55-196]OZB36595.1 MAG: ArsC family reductase [Halothiobacillus sp. 15-55-196]OZB55598.1 MAG: ArsC family reductase [Halothiobacillus sp. 14-56-357]OZB77821.1 MAG: ArsC family reductase [Halothiobacillus sp. 13-55-115]
MMTLFGIPQCDTVKKARVWLTDHGVDYQFHDYKLAGVPEELLERWLSEFGWETVINRRGTSWRRLPEAERNAMTTATARAAALSNPSLIKRPVLVSDQFTLIGFDPEQWQKSLTQATTDKVPA